MTLEFTVDGLALEETGVKFRNLPRYLYESQLKMRHLENGTHEYRSEDVERFIAINWAPTGGGKTMFWEDGSIRHRKDTLVMYPTNALTADQVKSISNDISEVYNAEDDVAIIMITAPELEKERKKRDGEVGGNGELISTLIREKKREYDSVIAFTNPDIFTNMRHNNYKASLANRVSEIFERVVVDEFHVADTAGKTTILNLVRQLWNNEDTRTDEVIFLTATPDRRIKQMLNEDDVYEVYSKEQEADLSNVKNDENYNAIQPPVDIEFRRGRTFQVGSQLLSDKWRQGLLDFIRQDQRTIIMLDSKKEVNKVSNFLSQALDEYESIKIDGNTKKGLKSKIQRFNDESTKSVITSNSAVEVGIDFETDQIIFSGMKNSRFLQRLGRLRNREDKRKAIAYVPANVYEALERAKDNGTIPDSGKVSRDTLQEILDNAFFHSREPHSYPATFGAHEAYEHALREAKGEAPETKHKVMENAKKRIEEDMLEPYGIDVDWEESHDIHKRKIDDLLPTLMQYRSSGPSVIMYRKDNNIISTEEFQSVLRTGDIEIVPRNEFYARVPENQHSSIKSKESYTNGYIIYHGNEYQQRVIRNKTDQNVKGRKIYIKPSSELINLLNQDPPERFPTELTNYEIIVDERDMSPIDVETLNKYLTNAKPLVYPIQLAPREAQKEYNLDSFFFLDEIADGKSTRSSVAVGNKALYLYCIRQEQLYRENPERDDLGIRIPNTIWDT